MSDEQDGEGAHHGAEQGLERHRSSWWWSSCGWASRRPWGTIHRTGSWRIGNVGQTQVAIRWLKLPSLALIVYGWSSKGGVLSVQRCDRGLVSVRHPHPWLLPHLQHRNLYFELLEHTLFRTLYYETWNTPCCSADRWQTEEQPQMIGELTLDEAHFCIQAGLLLAAEVHGGWNGFQGE